MKASRLNGFGAAPEVLGVQDLPTPAPGEGELLLEMLFAPINPADLNVIEGKYGELPELPAVIGNEGVGRVAALGAGVTGFAPGDLVLPLARGTWAQFMVAKAARVMRVPAGIDPRQASMLTANPPSAWAMLEDFVTLQPGDWVVQNAANSGVGRSVIQIAKSRGWKTLNVVRRPELIDELKALGADAVVLETEDLRASAGTICGGRRPRLALNAVGGASALNLANALADGGTHVTYGAMGRQPLKLPNGLLIFRGLEFRGFWLRRWVEGPPKKVHAAMAALTKLTAEGALRVPVQQVFPLGEVLAACAAAAGDKRSGKILLDLQA